MFAGLVFVGPHINEIFLQASDFDRLHGDHDLRGVEVMRVSLDWLKDLLGHCVHQVPPPGKLEAHHPLHILGGRHQWLGLFEAGPGLTEVYVADAKVFEAVNVSRDDGINCFYVDRSLPFYMNWSLKSYGNGIDFEMMILLTALSDTPGFG